MPDKTIKIKLLKDCCIFKAGEIVEMVEPDAKLYVALGRAVFYEEPAQEDSSLSRIETKENTKKIKPKKY